MRRGYGIALAVVLVLVAVLIGVGAYNAGVHQGLAEAAESGEVVRYQRYGPGWGFFPFGLLFFPLLILGIFAFFRFALWGRRWDDHPHPMGPGGWAGAARGRDAFEEWHRSEHERREGDSDPERPDTA
ncbi:MAG TPA: hypothetical protein VK962_07865 [Actinomycetota bacterium]|nr:hypothetical protein [Actinomycetota bacterium]